MLKKLLLGVVGFFFIVSMAFAAIDINSASPADLQKLPGVGPTKAQAIVDYRQKNGPFKSAEDIKNVKGIGDKTFEKLKGEITVSGGGNKTAAVKADKPAAKPAMSADNKKPADNKKTAPDSKKK